jgi:hypothetical protein
MFPVVNVFFELGRQGASLGADGLEAFRLVDILQHTRLPNVGQVIACLNVINEAARQVRMDTTATLYVLDRRGDCIVAAQTQQSILRLWQQVAGMGETAAFVAEPPQDLARNTTEEMAAVHAGSRPSKQEPASD